LQRARPVLPVFGDQHLIIPSFDSDSFNIGFRIALALVRNDRKQKEVRNYLLALPILTNGITLRRGRLLLFKKRVSDDMLLYSATFRGLTVDCNDLFAINLFRG
jgi:hypothetical protein